MTKSKVTKPNASNIWDLDFPRQQEQAVEGQTTSEISGEAEEEAEAAYEPKLGVDMDHRLRRIKQVLRGWINYFRIGKFKEICGRIDRNLRYRLRMCIWKQWKTVGRRYKALRQLGMEKETAWKWANSRKGYARVASSPILTYTVTNKRLAKEVWRQ